MSAGKEEIIKACLALGFASAGVCAAAPSGRGVELRAWLDEGRQGGMSWMLERLEERTDITRLIEDRGVRSVVMVADQYAARGDGEGPLPPGMGRVARYARGRDYHQVVRRRLHRLADRLRERFPGEDFRAFVDTAPVMEREQAARAGLGFIGKHTLLIDPRRGSWIVLGGLASTVELDEERGVGVGEVDHCGTCTRCIDACPTGAIEPWRVDARRCIAYLTIEHEGAIEPALARRMGAWVFGCDVCQEVCPFNGAREGEDGGVARVHSLYRGESAARGGSLPLLEVLRWTPAERQVRLTVSASKRASLEMMRRNAVIAAVNGGALKEGSELRAEVERIAAEDAGPAGEAARGLGAGGYGSGSSQGAAGW